MLTQRTGASRRVSAVIVGLCQRLFQFFKRTKHLHTRHLLDLVDCAGVLGMWLARAEYKTACTSTVAKCEVLDNMRWNHRAAMQVLACENEALNLRRLYIWLMMLNLVMLICPIARHFCWEREMKLKAAKSK